MTSRTRPAIPATPRVTSPSPTPSETLEIQDSYFGPVTRSAARRRLPTPQTVAEHSDEDDVTPLSDRRRSRTRSRSPMETRRLARMTSAKTASQKKQDGAGSVVANGVVANGKSSSVNGHLAPPSSAPSGWSWRDFSRSPSPLGLIPIHRHWRTLVHKHEVPRKALHVSIGFFALWLYLSGSQTTAVTPWLLGALVPITSVEFLRHRYPAFNRIYVMFLGALMRESEFSGYNGVIFYLLGAWIVLGFFPKDVGMMGVLLLSWCDTAASTFGRMFGRYTPRIRKGKSLAGSLAAFLVGVATSFLFWGYLTPRTSEDFPFMFNGVLRLPHAAASALGLPDSAAIVTGGLALTVVSLWSGFVAAASEVVDIFGWDDNLTIPVLSGLGIWGFLKVFG